jgi:hypothetical protein
MSLEDNSATQLPTVEEPVIEDDPAAVRPVPFLGEDAVPLREPGAAELERERADRVQAIVRRRLRRPELPRLRSPGKPLTLGAIVALVAVAVFVASALGGGPDRDGTTDAAGAGQPNQRPESLSVRPGTIPSPPPRLAARRRADRAADRGAARRDGFTRSPPWPGPAHRGLPGIRWR